MSYSAKIFWVILLFSGLFLTSCSLSAEQEKSLNKAVTKYMKARNEEQLMSYIGLTHPNVVAYYLEQGDSIFKRRFTLVDDNGLAPFIQDPNIREIESKGKELHVRYRFLIVEDDFYNVKAKEAYIYAISEDDGKSWYFIEEKDYKNDSIIKPQNRLIHAEP